MVAMAPPAQENPHDGFDGEDDTAAEACEHARVRMKLAGGGVHVCAATDDTSAVCDADGGGSGGKRRRVGAAGGSGSGGGGVRSGGGGRRGSGVTVGAAARGTSPALSSVASSSGGVAAPAPGSEATSEKAASGDVLMATTQAKPKRKGCEGEAPKREIVGRRQSLRRRILRMKTVYFERAHRELSNGTLFTFWLPRVARLQRTH